ncbi:MAG: c-type cytochrome biogenesis protein CcmI [Pseudomonadota bacterium]
MMLWLAIAILTAAALLALTWPLMKRAEPPVPAEGADLAVYRDQLAELERDLKRGLIAPDAAAAARLEIERRLLAAEQARPAPRRQTTATRRNLVVALTLLVAAGAPALYLDLGAPGVPDRPLPDGPRAAGPSGAGGSAENPPVPPALQPLVGAADTLASKLDADPSDAVGWARLGDLYLTLQRYADAADALEQAIQQGADPKLTQSRYGEALTQLAQGAVTPDAATALRKGLAADPTDPRARFYLALAEAEAGRLDAALDAWRKLLADAPADAGWRPMVEETIAAAERAKARGAGGAGTGAAPNDGGGGTEAGPDAEAMAAMADMKPEERQAFIQSMVDKLAQRLQANPNDLDGWLELARSYKVLGQDDKSLDAMGRAAALAPERTDIQLGYAEALVRATPADRPLPAAFDETIGRIKAKEPGNLAATYFEGLGAARAGKPDEARRLWGQVLAALPAEAPQRAAIEREIEALPAE